MLLMVLKGRQEAGLVESRGNFCQKSRQFYRGLNLKVAEKIAEIMKVYSNFARLKYKNDRCLRVSIERLWRSWLRIFL